MEYCRLSFSTGSDQPAVQVVQLIIDHPTTNMCNSRSYPPPPPPVVETTGEKGGVHLEGVHHISIVMSSGAVFAVIVFIAAWCLLRKKKTCCKENGGDSPSVQIAIPSAPLSMTSPTPPNAPVNMANLPSNMLMNPAPPTDIELALFRAQEKERQRQLHQLQQPSQPETLPPALQMALANRFPVV